MFYSFFFAEDSPFNRSPRDRVQGARDSLESKNIINGSGRSESRGTVAPNPSSNSGASDDPQDDSEPDNEFGELTFPFGGETDGSPETENPQLAVPKPSSSQAVRDYYLMLNRREYSKTWGLLSPGFKRKHSKNSFYEYKTWWNKVDRIVIGQRKQVSQGENQAVVEISLTYHLKDGRTREDYNKIFYLVFKENTNSWILDDLLKGSSAPNYRSQGEANATIVTTDPTEPIKNVRSSPNTDGDNIVGKIRIGSRVEVLREGRDRTNDLWYKIYDPSSGTRGWIAEQFVERD
ncbi:MAG: SH3 domain-containing protein [Moorea sp. SIO3I7]|uniref:SH3 domain-containing protein n=1 Tax=Moorena sp. SIO3I8 TaxID=2607833 RepID=UPI0013C10964|nr:SH3 domain-containing protein [Moorena sp. SIO3I8]NEN95506.1 SH3 domain-containing protein [Moorena sp. SIO3I7]NEO04576.1 SH3 domain-containing protein [Moorena sp. SIO3I8]